MSLPVPPTNPSNLETEQKPPQNLGDGVYAFPPNRDILGGTSYFILNSQGNLLIDCPPWRGNYPSFLADHGGVRWLISTHRGGISPHIATIQQKLGCELVIQEQEAYLLPSLATTTFNEQYPLTEHITLIWTPGHSPGSACLFDARQGGSLWTGRHLLPDRQGNPAPLRTAKTFHWGRQLQSVQRLRDRFSPLTLQRIYPGANTGFLRGKKVITEAYERLQAIDLKGMEQTQPLL